MEFVLAWVLAAGLCSGVRLWREACAANAEGVAGEGRVCVCRGILE